MPTGLDSERYMGPNTGYHGLNGCKPTSNICNVVLKGTHAQCIRRQLQQSDSMTTLMMVLQLPIEAKQEGCLDSGPPVWLQALQRPQTALIDL